MSQQWPDVAENDGYTEYDNKNEPGNDLWESRRGIDIDSCKAVCNNNSKCKSIAHNKTTGVCFLKTTDGTNKVNDQYQKFYVKNGEPANTKKMFYTKPITPIRSWLPDMFERNGNRCNQPQGGVPVQVGLDISDAKTCSWVPFAKDMCPNIGDFRYFRHTQANSSNVGNYDYSENYKNNFERKGSQMSAHENASVICGYNRIPQSEWRNLDSWFSGSEKSRIIKEYCEGPGITSKELAADSQYCGNTTYFSSTEYNQAILNKLKTESNWWNDATNCTNFQNVIIGQTNDQAVMRVAGELIDTLPSTGWSDDLVRALNALKGNGNVPGSVKSKIDPKIDTYCISSNGDTNSKCACRNAAVKGKAKTCAANIVGCEDVKRYTDLIEKAKGVNQTFGAQMEMIYDPNSQSDACQNTKVQTSTILRYGNVGDSKLDVAACFTEFENSGNIGGAVSTKCDIAVKKYESEQASSSSGSGSGSSTSTDSSGTFIKGETAGIKNDYWLVALCMCFVCFMIIGIVLAAFLM